ncbi:MAG: AMP-binding protein [Comamonas sp.]
MNTDQQTDKHARAQFEDFYQRSINDRDAFWAEQVELIDWQQKPTQICDYSNPPFARWFVGGTTNLCHNAVDRHLAERGEQKALIAISTETNTEKTYTYRELHGEVNRMAAALQALGVEKGDRVQIYMPMIAEAAFAMLACVRLGAIHSVVFGGFASGALASRIDDAQPKVIVSADAGSRGGRVVAYKPLLDEALKQASHQPAAVLMVNRGLADMPMRAGRDHDWAALRALHSESVVDCVWVESTHPSYTLYTSGTTGKPKAALYSHRSSTLHAYAAALPDVMNLSARDSVLPVVPMFHVNAWGIPYSAALTGCKLVFPGPALDGKSVYELIEAEGVTFAAGVPTVWQMLLSHMKPGGLRFSKLNRTVIGGSACPPAMISAFQDDYGVSVLHAWGMTEMSPLGTLCTLKNKHLSLPKDEQMKILQKQGRAIYGVEMKIVNDEGKEQPWDGKAYGDLLVRGPWIIDSYYKGEGNPLVDGWFPTGDVATIDADGFMQITDRSKDVVKSGGEWISSIDIENIAMAHPAVAMAACIGVPHPKWDERPIVAVAKKPGAEVSREELLKFFEGKTAKWQIPDDVVFVDAIPLGATGKMLKTKLREQLKDYKLPTA